jgi:hypothetical protein
LRTRLIGLGELVHDLDDGQLRLGRRPVAAARSRRCRRLLRLREGAPFRRRTKQCALALGELFFQELQFALRGDRSFAAELSEFSEEALQLGVELRVLALEKHRDLTQQLRITDLIEPKHGLTTASPRAASKSFWRVGDDQRRRREGDAPDERAAFEEQLQLAHRESAGGVGKDVTFVPEADAPINGQIDAEYRSKYRRHGGRYVDPMVAETARATTIKLVPH